MISRYIKKYDVSTAAKSIELNLLQDGSGLRALNFLVYLDNYYIRNFKKEKKR
jgi:hypothetical protein